MNVSPEMKAAQDELAAAQASEAARYAEIEAAHNKLSQTGKYADAPTTELHQRWTAARRATEEAWAKVMAVQDQELRR